MWELILATNFGSPLQMVTKVGCQILANKFGFVPDCLTYNAIQIRQKGRQCNKPGIHWRPSVSVYGGFAY